MIVAAHDEEDVIERRLENLLGLDYPRRAARDRRCLGRLRGSHGRARRDGGGTRAPSPAPALSARGEGRGAEPGRSRDEGEILAFSDANAQWQPDALRKLVRNFADPEVAYVCGSSVYEAADGTNREGTYWRFEAGCAAASRGSARSPVGSAPIYTVRRSDYVEVDPRFGHDLALPYLMVQRGRRAVYEPEALASEKPSRDIEDEYRRKVRMFEHCWLIVLRGRMLRGLGPTYLLEILSHRHLRYASGLLHLVLLGSSLALVTSGVVYQVVLGAQLGLLLAAAFGVGIARYYVLVTWATVVSLVRYLRFGVPAVWAKAEGTR